MSASPPSAARSAPRSERAADWHDGRDGAIDPLALRGRCRCSAADLVAGFPRDPERPAQLRHLLPIQEAGNELKTLIHGLTRLPGHFASPQKARLCNPCLWYELSPIPQEGHQQLS